MADQHIVGGTLYPIFINETITQQTITPGSYMNITVSSPPPPTNDTPSLLTLGVG